MARFFTNYSFQLNQISRMKTPYLKKGEITKTRKKVNTARLSPPSPKFGGVKLGKRRTVLERGQTE
jgi:hypothetical protein